MLALARLQHDGESCRVMSCRVMSSDVLSCLVMWGVLLDGVRRLVACVGVCWSVCVHVVEESVRVEQVRYRAPQTHPCQGQHAVWVSLLSSYRSTHPRGCVVCVHAAVGDAVGLVRWSWSGAARWCVGWRGRRATTVSTLVFAP